MLSVYYISLHVARTISFESPVVACLRWSLKSFYHTPRYVKLQALSLLPRVANIPLRIFGSSENGRQPIGSPPIDKCALRTIYALAIHFYVSIVRANGVITWIRTFYIDRHIEGRTQCVPTAHLQRSTRMTEKYTVNFNVDVTNDDISI